MRQGDTISHKLFMTYLEHMIKNLNWQDMEVNINEEIRENFGFADDLILLTDKVYEAQTKLITLKEASN